MKAVETQREGSYRQILKSSTMIGASSIVRILLGIIQTKVLAIILGPSGVGLIGVYGSITGIVGNVAGMGIGSSGVRQIAESVATGDHAKIGRTTVTLRRFSLYLGVFGAVLLVALSVPISKLTFGNTRYAFDLSLLSATILLGSLSAGQTALIQGMRRIGELAKVNVFGALFGTVFSIPIIYIWGTRGVVPFLIVVSATSVLTSWRYAHRVRIVHVEMDWAEIRTEARPLLRLGSVIMASASVGFGTTYLLRLFVVGHFGLDSVGLYTAATTLSGVYVGFILEAMGKDFYPRLTAAAQDNTACNRLMNEQAEVGVLLAVPGIILSLAFAPIIIHLFYSVKFSTAFELLRWQILGILLRVVTWPMGYIILAKGKGGIFFWTEFTANAVLVGLTWLGIAFCGLTGMGMAFFGMYVIYWFLIYFVVKHLTGFAWSAANIRIGFTILPGVALVFLTRYVLSDFWYMLLGGATTIAVGLCSCKALARIVGPACICSFVVRIKHRFCGTIA
jgi:PST family polysaccharide transporter